MFKREGNEDVQEIQRKSYHRSMFTEQHAPVQRSQLKVLISAMKSTMTRDIESLDSPQEPFHI